MTPEQPDSICFDETEPSLMEWTDILKLGRAIVSQLDLDESDILSRWMAFRLAELINQTDTDESMQDVVSDLILDLWHRRSHWPNGWPPTRISSQMAWLFPSEQQRQQTSEQRRDQLMRRVIENMTEEYRFWLSLVSDNDLLLTPAEEAMLAIEPVVSQRIMQRLIELSDRPETEQGDAAATERLESIFGVRRTLLQSLLDTDASEVSTESDAI